MIESQRPQDALSRVRMGLLGASLLFVVLAVSGVLAASVFSQPTSLKYLVTVLGGALLVVLCVAQAPLKVLVGVAILVAPFDFVSTVQGLSVTPLLAVDVLALLLWVPRRTVGAPSALRWASVAFALLVLPAVAGSDAPAAWLLWLAVTITTGALTFLVAREPGGARFVVTMIALSAVIQSLLALWEWRTGQRLNLYQQSGTIPAGSEYFFTYGRAFRPEGALPDPIGLGQVLALCIPMMVALAAATRRWLVSLVILAAMGVAAVALVLSLSRMSLIGAAVGLGLAVVLLPRPELLRTGAAVAVTVVVVALAGLAAGGAPLRQRLESILHPTSAHVSTAAGDLNREHIWLAAVKTAEANPLAGVGFGNVTKFLPRYGAPVTTSSHAHDTYLQFFAEGGILALIGLAGVICAAFVDLGRAFTTRRVWVAGATGALVATLLSWITDVEVRYVQVSAMVAVLLGLIAALAVRRGAPAGAGAAPDVPPAVAVRLSPPALAGTTPDFSPVTSRALAGTPTLAIISPSREDGGAEHYLRTIAREAGARGWEVHVGCPALESTAGLVAELAELGVRCHALRIPARSPDSRGQALGAMACEARSTLGLLARVKPTATLVILPHPDQASGLALGAAVWPRRSVASVHLVPPGLTFTGARLRLYRLCRALGQRWITVSADSQRRLAAALGVGPSVIPVIPNGVEDIAVAPDARPAVRDRVRAELEIDPRARVIVTVGRLNAQKGYDLIADSIPTVLARHPDAVWLWVGDGPSRTSLAKRLRRAGIRDHVRMLGVRSDVPSLLAASDLFVLPSRYEGSPFAVLEALVCELPVIVSDAGPLPEIVSDGVDGRTVPAGSAAALALATVDALNAPEQMRALAGAGRRRALRDFSRERMVSSMLASLLPATPPASDPELIGATAHRPTDIVRPRGAR